MKHPEKADLQKQTVRPGEEKKTINGHETSCRGGENILKHFMVMVAQPYTLKNH